MCELHYFHFTKHTLFVVEICHYGGTHSPLLEFQQNSYSDVVRVIKLVHHGDLSININIVTCIQAAIGQDRHTFGASIENIFLFIHFNICVFKRTVSLRWFFYVHSLYVSVDI